MSTPKLHYDPNSSCSRRVRLTIAVLGIAVDQHRIDLASPDDCTSLRRLNPNGKVPVLEDRGLVLWESHAIMQYLCNRTPDQRLYPPDLAARADVDRWLFWIAGHLEPAAGGLNIENMWKQLTDGSAPDPATVARLETMLHAAAQLLDRHLADRPWIAGDSLSLADLSVAATVMYREPARHPLGSYRHLLGLLDRVAALDAWPRTDPRMR
jgi:glutathione S-transferase